MTDSQAAEPDDLDDDDEVSPDWYVEFIMLLDANLVDNHEDAAVIARGWVAEGYGDVLVTAPDGGPTVQIDGLTDDDADEEEESEE